VGCNEVQNRESTVHQHKTFAGGTHLQLLTKRLPLLNTTTTVLPITSCTRPAKRTRQIFAWIFWQQLVRAALPRNRRVAAPRRTATRPQRSNRPFASQAAGRTASQSLVHCGSRCSAAR
jgi:hypothetical protein